MKLGRVCVESQSRSTVTDYVNGYFFQEYLVDMDDKNMVKMYKKIAQQEAWDEAVSLACGEGDFYGCSSYPDSEIKVWATSNKRGSKLKFNQKELNKSYKFLKSLSKDTVEELMAAW
jgi:ssDNA-binding Zn-finger/Zn-ribbon topoisomerase 1